MTSLRTRADAFALFDTAVGVCGIAWAAEGIAGTQLPEETVAATRTRLQQRFPKATFAFYQGSVGASMRHVAPAQADQIASECEVVIGSTSD